MDHFDRSLLNYFSASAIDRAFDKRKEHGWIEQRLQHRSSRFYPFLDLCCFIEDEDEPRPVVLQCTEVSVLIERQASLVFLGCDGDSACFAVECDDDRVVRERRGQFLDLKSVSRRLKRHDAALLGYARAMIYWHRRHRYCGVCGAGTRSRDAGHVRVCTSDACASVHFPRTDPAVIVAVCNGEHCLLGRQHSWAPSQYSVIAGFVEPGESLEHAVVREVLEETGIEVADVHYHSSQPWPFPGSIMLGFSATARTRRVRLNDPELEDARWFSRQSIRSEIEARRLRLPPPVSIAYRLIEDWFDAEQSGPRLSEVMRAGLPWQTS